MISPVSKAAEEAKISRNIGTVVATFGAVAPLLAQTDMIATLPSIVLADALKLFGLQALPAPFPITPMPHVVCWSTRLTSDPASLWLRICFLDVLKTQLSAADHLVSRL